MDTNTQQAVYASLAKIGLSETEWHSLRNKPTSPLEIPHQFTPHQLASYIDHTILKPDTTDEAVQAICQQAIEHQFASVCVNSCHVATCSSLLRHTPVKTCAVAGFPLGAMATHAKADETTRIIAEGGQEIDMVMNIGKLKSGQFDYVRQDITAVVQAAQGNPVKVILETGLLSTSEIVLACILSVIANAAFVKTSTGFGHGGATAEHIKLMRDVVGGAYGVKASGGVRDAETAITMIRAGANRLGTSNGVAIVTGLTGATGY